MQIKQIPQKGQILRRCSAIEPLLHIPNTLFYKKGAQVKSGALKDGRYDAPHNGIKGNDDRTVTFIVKGNNKGSDPHDYGQYWVLDADRQQSGICFYVLYFLDCLFAQLGVEFNKDKLLEIEDLRRLCFFTTKCSYDLVKEENSSLGTLATINAWLTSNNCRGQLKMIIKSGEREIDLTNIDGQWSNGSETIDTYHTTWPSSPTGNWKDVTIEHFRQLFGYVHVESHVDNMYANSGNFPNASVSSVISSLENSFGIRFLYDPEKRLVTACLLRDIYKRKGALDFKGKVLSMTPINEKITGIRMAYSAESESKEQRKNIRNGVKDYDTEYDYIDYQEDKTIVDLNYTAITKKVSAENRNVYVDQETGNSYRVKIDSAAEDSLSLRPVLFQVAQYKGVEFGDCSERHKDYVKELISDFRPLTVNVVNAKDYNNDTTGEVSPLFAPLLDVEMEHEYLEKKIQQIVFQNMDAKDLHHDSMTKGSNLYAWPDGIEQLLVQSFSIAESYDPTQTDSGNSPLQDIDWGLTIGIMRGAGSDAEIINFDRGYDGFDNSRWKDTIGIYELTSDSMDLKGAIFDYNGIDGPTDGPTDQGGIANSHEYVDLGLPSGTLWATCNIGAYKPEEGGDFFAWAETSIKSDYSKETYKYGTNKSYQGLQYLTKYCYNSLYGYNGFVDNKTELEDADDAAMVKWGSDFRIPSKQQFEELTNDLYTTVTPHEISGVKGILITSKANSNSIFLPQAGWYEHSNWAVGKQYNGGRYWSRNIATDKNPGAANCLKFWISDNEHEVGVDFKDRTMGFSIRPIYVPTEQDGDEQIIHNGDGGGERFSLQIRAFAPFVYYIDGNGELHISKDVSLAGEAVEGVSGKTWLIPCDDDERDQQGHVINKIRSRGLFDSFMREHAKFLLGRKKYKVKVLATIAQLLDIRNHWTDFYVLDGKVGLIDKVNYKIQKSQGVREAELEFYSY